MAEKDKKDKMVDHPAYDPNLRVPFPPKDGDSPFGQANERKEQAKPAKQPYYETYTSETPTPDPSQTTPGAPDIRDPDTRLPDGTDLSKLSPHLDHKE